MSQKNMYMYGLINYEGTSVVAPKFYDNEVDSWKDN